MRDGVGRTGRVIVGEGIIGDVVGVGAGKGSNLIVNSIAGRYPSFLVSNVTGPEDSNMCISIDLPHHFPLSSPHSQISQHLV